MNIDSKANQPGNLNTQQISAVEFSAKFKSKREVYQFLCGDVRAYLAGYDSVSIYFLKALVIGEKKFIKNEDIMHMYIPYYQGLSIQEMLKYAEENPKVSSYLPEGPDLARIPRAWLADMLYTLLEEPFQNWVKNRVASRNSKVAEKGNKMIDLDPEIAKAFNQCTQISTVNGTAFNLLKLNSKRRRTKAQIQLEQEEAEFRQQAEIDKDERIRNLQDQLKQSEMDRANGEAATEILSGFISKGKARQLPGGDVQLIEDDKDSNYVQLEPEDLI